MKYIHRFLQFLCCVLVIVIFGYNIWFNFYKVQAMADYPLWYWCVIVAWIITGVLMIKIAQK